jgi:hypothetical protein
MLVATGERIGFGGGGATDPGAQWLVGLSEMGGPTRLLNPVMKWGIACAPPTIWQIHSMARARWRCALRSLGRAMRSLLTVDFAHGMFA